MADLLALPEWIHIRHPDGTLEGPLPLRELERRVLAGELSPYSWIYDGEKREAAPLHRFHSLYSMHPQSSLKAYTFTGPRLLEIAYYSSAVGFFLFCIPAIPISLGLIGFLGGIRVAMKDAEFLTTPNKFRCVIAIVLGFFTMCINSVIVYSIFSEWLQ
ncbi:MAG: hypothetical protein SFY68_15135 [Candidatus Sumerlaeia bacterium]|nr:hypothetical protein [Candidatus Sumerlaeia bacterium]